MNHLSPGELDRLQQILQRGKEELRARIVDEREKADREGPLHADDAAGDDADHAFAELRVSIDRELIDCHLAELKAFEAALARMAEGSFGLCIDCGTEIGYPRLEAQPAATRCARCQALHEKTFSVRR